MPNTIRKIQAQEITLGLDAVRLEGNLNIPDGAYGAVVFAHGSGSSRFSPRNTYVARALNERGLATLSLDLLTPREEAVDRYSGQLRFDVEMLADRLAGATTKLCQDSRMKGLAIGYFGASTGAAAALLAAAERPELVSAVVSRGGRPDLAGPALSRVRAPTLLLVGGLDRPVVDLNREALKHLQCTKEIQIVPGASHLFEEPGTLEVVARQARAWFEQYLRPEQRTEAA